MKQEKQHYKISGNGQMTFPVRFRQRWNIEPGNGKLQTSDLTDGIWSYLVIAVGQW